LVNADRHSEPYDPVAMVEEARHYLPIIDYAVDGSPRYVKGADALVIITEWNQFRALDMAKVRNC